ncbi:MAG: acetyl-CoA acetyltransferase [Candidatus Calescibacterium sp.]|jgi:acetyl-CoA C-acetyltransferase|nr:acetyl-CoA acetyltransferase [Candidatus Calescibacterium sp.]
MRKGNLDDVVVIGVGCSKFGERHDKSYEDLAVEAFEEALQDAGIKREDIQAAWLGTYFPGFGGGMSGSSLADALKIYGKPITRVENFCATGMEAFRNAAFSVAAGIYDIVLALGVEKLKDRQSRGLPRIDWHPLLIKGNTAPGVFALAARRYMETFGIDRKPLARVAVKNHRNGARNKKAHFQKEITEEEVLAAPMVAYPFGLFDCCPVTDGAACAIIARKEVARDLKKDYIKILGLGLAVTSARPQFKPDFDYIGFPATKLAAQQAYEMAGISPQDVDFAEVHDCFTWTEISNYEDLGFAEKGQGWKLIMNGDTFVDGKIPVNPSGGLKSFGHPIGASGLRMIYEVVNQLRGKVEKERQVRIKRGIGLAHNLGGPGSVASVTILGI